MVTFNTVNVSKLISHYRNEYVQEISMLGKQLVSVFTMPLFKISKVEY